MNDTTQAVSRDSLMLDTPYVEPVGSKETVIAEIWSTALGIDGVGVEDDFFDLGGNSIIAARIANQISQDFGIVFKTGALVDASTVRNDIQYG